MDNFKDIVNKLTEYKDEIIKGQAIQEAQSGIGFWAIEIDFVVQ